MSTNRLPVLRHYYLDIIDVSLIILEGQGVDLINGADENNMYSFIVNLEDAFELYVRQILTCSLETNNRELTVLDGNNEGRSKLFSDNTQFDAKPDLIIKKSGLTLAIGDVKYKTNLGETDRYQLISHSVAYGTNKAFFVTPVPEGGMSGGNFVGTVGQIKVYYYQLDLNSANLLSSEQNFINWIENLICSKS